MACVIHNAYVNYSWFQESWVSKVRTASCRNSAISIVNPKSQLFVLFWPAVIMYNPNELATRRRCLLLKLGKLLWINLFYKHGWPSYHQVGVCICAIHLWKSVSLTDQLTEGLNRVVARVAYASEKFQAAGSITCRAWQHRAATTWWLTMSFLPRNSSRQQKVITLSQVCLVCPLAICVASLRDDVFQVCSQHENMSR